MHLKFRYKTECPQAWLSLLSQFEKSKKMANPAKKNLLNIQLPYGMDRFYQRVTGKYMDETLEIEGKNHNVKFMTTNGSLRLQWEAIDKLFEPIVRKIIQKIDDVAETVTFSKFL